MARRVEQVEGQAVPLEGHHRRGDRDAPLPLHLHPVRPGAPLFAARLDRAGHLDRAAEQQQLLGQRRLCRRPGGEMIAKVRRFSTAAAIEPGRPAASRVAVMVGRACRVEDETGRGWPDRRRPKQVQRSPFGRSFVNWSAGAGVPSPGGPGPWRRKSGAPPGQPAVRRCITVGRTAEPPQEAADVQGSTTTQETPTWRRT